MGSKKVHVTHPVLIPTRGKKLPWDIVSNVASLTIGQVSALLLGHRQSIALCAVKRDIGNQIVHSGRHPPTQRQSVLTSHLPTPDSGLADLLRLATEDWQDPGAAAPNQVITASEPRVILSIPGRQIYLLIDTGITYSVLLEFSEPLFPSSFSMVGLMASCSLHSAQTFFVLCLTLNFHTPRWSSLNVPLHFTAGTSSSNLIPPYILIILHKHCCPSASQMLSLS
jgi:hypothetical protein